jgi:hypothetical protein
MSQPFFTEHEAIPDSSLTFADSMLSRLMPLCQTPRNGYSLHAPARSAATVLERAAPLRPTMDNMDNSKARFTELPIGTILILIASEERALCVELMARDGNSVGGMFEYLLHTTTSQMPDEFDFVAALPSVQGELLHRYGIPPEQEEGEQTFRTDVPILLGCMLRALRKERRDEISALVEKSMEMAICPVLIGLHGKLANRHRDGQQLYTGLWPIFLPMAPYFEWVQRQLDPTAKSRLC